MIMEGSKKRPEEEGKLKYAPYTKTPHERLGGPYPVQVSFDIETLRKIFKTIFDLSGLFHFSCTDQTPVTSFLPQGEVSPG